MKRRFTDIEKWAPWFRKLSPENKLFWIYIHDDCDEVGVWTVDLEKASFNIGCEYEIEVLKKAFAEKIAVFGGKWWILNYVELQYKELRLPTKEQLEQNPNLKHTPAPRYINLLKSHGLWEQYQKSLVDSQLTPSSLPLNSPEEEEEEEVFKGEEKKGDSFESGQETESQNSSFEAQDEKKSQDYDAEFDKLLKSAEVKSLQRQTPHDMTH